MHNTGLAARIKAAQDARKPLVHQPEWLRRGAEGMNSAKELAR